MVEGGDQGQSGLPAWVWKLLLKNYVKNGFGEHNEDDNEGGGDHHKGIDDNEAGFATVELTQWGGGEVKSGY